jgi:predicted ArsR family transcriptional regulator
MIKIKLTRTDRIKLEKFRYQASSRDSEKALMVLMNADGQSVADISSSLRRNPHTVREWLKRYKAYGLSGLSRKFSPGRPSYSQELYELCELCMEQLGGDPVFFNSIHKFDSFYYFS